MLLKIRLLRSFHIFQAKHANISIKQGPSNVDLATMKGSIPHIFTGRLAFKGSVLKKGMGSNPLKTPEK
jgi:hypothetical protein